MEKNVEVEIRAEVEKELFETILAKLHSLGKLISKTKRLSVMLFGENENNKFDIRIRITNGKSEIVIKKGSLHSHDRTEFSQPILKDQFLGIVKIFNQFNFKTKVGERETYNFDLGGEIVASLVKAGDISYVEIEKMSVKEDIEKNKNEIEKILENLRIQSLKSEDDFNELCSRLDKHVDWDFAGDEPCYRKLEKLLEEY